MKCGDLPDTHRDVKARFPKPARNISIARFHLHLALSLSLPPTLMVEEGSLPKTAF